MQDSKTAILKSSSWSVNGPFSQLLIAKFFLNIYFLNAVASSLCLYEYMDQNSYMDKKHPPVYFQQLPRTY